MVDPGATYYFISLATIQKLTILADFGITLGTGLR